MSFVPIQVLALVTKSMEMRLPMQVYLHEISILNAVYGGQVEVLHAGPSEDLLDGESEMQRLSKIYGLNPQKQPWAEAIFGAYGHGAATLEAFYDEKFVGMRAELLADATPFPDAPETFAHESTGKTVVPNVADIGTAQEQVPAARKKAAAKKATGGKKAEAVS